MKAKKLNETRIFNMAIAVIVLLMVIVGTSLANTLNEIPNTANSSEPAEIEEHIKSEVEVGPDIENWMTDLERWDVHRDRLLEPQTPQTLTDENNFTFRSGQFINFLTEEKEGDIELEDWMMDVKKLKDQV